MKMFAPGQLLICSSAAANDEWRSRAASVPSRGQDIAADLFSSASSELLLEAVYHKEKSIINQLCLIISPRNH